MKDGRLVKGQIRLARVEGRWLKLPRSLRREKIVTVELVEKARARLLPGDARKRAWRRAEMAGDLTAGVEYAIAFVLHPLMVEQGWLRLSTLVKHHAGEGGAIWLVKRKPEDGGKRRWELWGEHQRAEATRDAIDTYGT